jgi:hypothetical protein
VIVGSLLLILVAVAMLGLGLVRGSNAFLVGSIAASLLAAIALIAGARRSAAVRATPDNDAFDGLGDEPTGGAAERVAPVRNRSRPRSTTGRVYRHQQAEPAAGAGTVLVDDEPPEPASSVAGPMAEPAEPVTAPPGEPAEPATAASQPPANGRSVELDLDLDLDEHPDGPDEDDDPPGEPAAQLVSPADAARVARMSTDVLVIDGRPRYHQAGCVHLLGRESEALPVSEAVELGFTPCGLCEPDTALLAGARRA